MTSTNGQASPTSVRALVLLLTGVVAIAAGLVAFVASGAATLLAASPALVATPASGPLNVDAIPPHARYLAPWVVRAGSICPQITPPMIAAHIDWRAVGVPTPSPTTRPSAVGLPSASRSSSAARGRTGATTTTTTGATGRTTPKTPSTRWVA
ncbi:hypothetical protein [Salinispora arenicola]|uniref:hypothetical protein n=1 Tax=Salinispora arenicola TaxID=168697 RepID=UPI0016A00D21|nr:hypothetical protein [Salinispora arenicola]NIL64882.1 hypothetical protein [Salinispora arenicola]